MKRKTFRIFIVFLLLVQVASPVPAASAALAASSSVVLMDSVTNQIVYSKNPYLRRAPASTTKLLTALVAIERMDLNAIVTIPAYVEKIPPSKIHLRRGEKYRVRELVRAILINSANDAAEALAHAGGGGSRAKFVGWMNDKVKALGGNKSHFVNPSGLPAGGQYSTAYDMALIMDAVNKSPFLVQTLETRTLIIKNFSGRKIFLRNHNRMLWRSSRQVIGKTGWTRLARHCFVGEFVYNNRKYLVSMLGSHALWRDLKALVDLRYGSSLKASENKTKNWANPGGKTIQLALKKAGFYKGPINGKVGPKTRSAIKKFQKANGIKTTGNVGPQTWSQLRSFAV